MFIYHASLKLKFYNSQLYYDKKLLVNLMGPNKKKSMFYTKSKKRRDQLWIYIEKCFAVKIFFCIDIDS